MAARKWTRELAYSSALERAQTTHKFASNTLKSHQAICNHLSLENHDALVEFVRPLIRGRDDDLVEIRVWCPTWASSPFREFTVKAWQAGELTCTCKWCADGIDTVAEGRMTMCRTCWTRERNFPGMKPGTSRRGPKQPREAERNSTWEPSLSPPRCLLRCWFSNRFSCPLELPSMDPKLSRRTSSSPIVAIAIAVVEAFGQRYAVHPYVE